jgi:hypothetical protein
MDTVLGLIGLVFYVVAVLALSAGMTALVVKLSPTRSGSKSSKSSA